MLRAISLPVVLTLAMLSPAKAATEAEVDVLFEAMRIPDLMAILRQEGLDQSTDFSDSMFPDRSVAWSAVVSGIYDVPTMTETFRTAFGAALVDDDISPLIDFYTSERGTRIVEQELSARTTLINPTAEDAAINAFADMVTTDPDAVESIEAFIAANDLIELNVMGGLNSSLAFYNGLADGEAFEMTQDEILSTVWEQEEKMRASSYEWLTAYLGLAFHLLEDGDIDAYVAMSDSAAGADLNRAVFAGYDTVFTSVSYTIGAAAARFAMGEDL